MTLGRRIVGTLALLLLVGSSFAAFRQSPRANPYGAPALGSIDWWLYPSERNAFLRAPSIGSDLRDVFALPGTEKLWVVGTGGLILHSEDGGRTWVRQPAAPGEKPAAKPAAPVQASWLTTSDAWAMEPQSQGAANPDAASRERAPKGYDPRVQQQNPSGVQQQAPPVQQQQAPPPAKEQIPPFATTPHPSDINEWVTPYKPRFNLAGDDQAQQGAKPAPAKKPAAKQPVRAATAAPTQQPTAAKGQPTPASPVALPLLGDPDFTEGLTAVYFTDAQNGWIVGDDGSILRSNDGGTSWELTRLPDSGAFTRWSGVFATDPQHAWAYAEGVLARTENGRDWETIYKGDLTAVFFSNPKLGWAATKDALMRTEDGGKSWTRVAGDDNTPGPGARIQFFSSDEGFVTDARGGILSTHDGGKSWSRIREGDLTGIEAVRFVSAERGWAVGAGGRVAESRDQGVNWTELAFAAPAALAVETSDPSRAFMVGVFGDALVTDDGGRTWTPVASSTATVEGPLQTSVNRGTATVAWYMGPTVKFRLIDGRRGWFANEDGTFFITMDAGKTWRRTRYVYSRISRDTKRYQVKSVKWWALGNAGWEVGPRGSIEYVATDPAKPVRQNSTTTNDLRAVQFLDERSGWVVGDGGVILHTVDAGSRWTAQKSGVTTPLTALDVLDARNVWVADALGQVLATADAGATWELRNTYARRPAPWYYLALVLCAVGFVWALRPVPPTRSEFVADKLISDRAITLDDPDRLEFRPIALGLSRFLRNVDTQPPLTLAITGEWGTGKSSLMNMLRDDLQRRGWRPVWFNAWHHQKEEHLLAALLENIRAQAVPPAWHPGGLGFRIRLWFLRSREHWGPMLLAAAFLIFAAVYLTEAPNRLENITRQASAGAGWMKQTYARLTSEGTPKPKPSPNADATADASAGDAAAADTHPLSAPVAGGALVVLAGLLYQVWNDTKAFRSGVGQLMTSVAGKLKPSDLEAQAGFRYRFGREFGEVTQALGDRNMVVLIDDLDRCRPENVIEILEAINFLTTTGACFVVLGMALDRVRRCVGLAFRDVAQELVDGAAGNSAAALDEEQRRRRSEFARQYLEKLINIEVPVPTPTSEQTRRLFVGADEPPPPPLLRAILSTLSANLRPVIAAVVLATAATAGMMLGMHDAPRTEPTLASAGDASPTGNEAPPPVPSPPPESAESPWLRSFFVYNGPADVSRWFGSAPAALALLAAILAVVAARRRADAVVHDSNKFREALDIWHPLVRSALTSPRALKRFVNRVRYYAMRQGPAANGTRGIPEDILVAMAAIEQVRPDWLDDRDSYEDFAAFVASKPLPDEVRKHVGDFAGKPPPASFRSAFGRLVAGVRMQ